ncbi:MAG: alpha amylase C-terminal domain-containing protein, partial [Clostridia bacterium]|nr:alpha amylase C-terminal domain-containing protein [Clostridia bacterium]
LKYQWLGEFDRDMIRLVKRNHMFEQKMADLCLHKAPEKVLVFYRKGLLFAFNFSTDQSYTNVLVPVPNKADYEMKISSDDLKYGGQGNVAHMKYPVKEFDGKQYVELYLPARTAIVLKEVKKEEPKPVKKTKTETKVSKPKTTATKSSAKKTTKTETTAEKTAKSTKNAEKIEEKIKKTTKTKKTEKPVEEKVSKTSKAKTSKTTKSKTK